jgi:DNA-directed RNA polymerase sigma subunit (sigma70/sigma32)
MSVKGRYPPLVGDLRYMAVAEMRARGWLFREIGELLDITRARARQMNKRALRLGYRPNKSREIDEVLEENIARYWLT